MLSPAPATPLEKSSYVIRLRRRSNKAGMFNFRSAPVQKARGDYFALRNATEKQINALRSAADADGEATHCFCGFKLANVTTLLARS